MIRLNKKHWTTFGPAMLFACRASAPAPQVQLPPAPVQACPKCNPDPPKPALQDQPSDVFSFGSWLGKLSQRQGRCVLTLQSFGVQAQVIQEELDLSAPCYVSRWSTMPPVNNSNPKDTSIAHGGPGDAQVWQFGRDPATAVFVTSIKGFDPSLASPQDRQLKHQQKRCGNASQYIRLKGKNSFFLGEAFSSPKFVACALDTHDMKLFAVGAQDLFERRKKKRKN